MIDVVAFDLDDTLWVEARAQAYAMAELHRAWAVDAPLAAFTDVWRKASGRLFDAYTAGRMSHAEQRLARVRELLGAFGQPTDDATVASWTSRYVELYRAAWEPLPDALVALERLRALGVGLAVVTNGDGPMQRAKLGSMGLLPRFDWVVISGEVGAAKPDPAIFEHLIRVSGAAADRILFVGDRLDKDVLPARAMGMAALHMDHGRAHAGAAVVRSPGEVAAWVERARTPSPGAGAAPAAGPGCGP